jgi:hypothetical protein
MEPRMNAYRIALCVLGMVSFRVALAGGDDATPPAHWFISSERLGDGIRNYVAARDTTVAYSGSSSGVLKSKTSDAAASGTLMQAAAGGPYRGKRIQVSAYLRCRGVSQWAGVWIRAEDAQGGVTVFRNSTTQRTAADPAPSVRGDQDWTPIRITIDVPNSSVAIFYGVQLIGAGTVWIDDVSFDIVGDADPEDDRAVPAAYNAPTTPREGPRNLGFED